MNKKKIISILMIITMCFSFMPTMAFAADIALENVSDEVQKKVDQNENTSDIAGEPLQQQPVEIADNLSEGAIHKESTVLLEGEEPAEETQEQVAAPFLIQPRVPASDYPFQALYPTVLRTFGSGGDRIEHISTGASGGLGDISTTYETRLLHNSERIDISYKQIGYLMSGVMVQADGAGKIQGDPMITDQEDPATGAGTEWTHNFTITEIDPDISQITLRVAGVPVQSDNKNLYERMVIVHFDDKRGPAPSDVKFAISKTNPNKYTLSGADATMEYRLKKGTEWTSCTDGETLFDIPTSVVSYYVRYKAAADAIESQVKQVNMYPVRIAPEVSYDTTTEQFKGLTTEMEISVNEQPFVPVTEETIAMGVTPFIDSMPAGVSTPPVMTLKIRKKATDTSIESREATLMVYGRRGMPTGMTLDPNTFVMSGINGNIQYRKDGAEWLGIGSTSTKLYFENSAREDKEVLVEIRYKAIDKKASASLPQKFTLQKLLPPVKLSLDRRAEVITGFDPKESYLFKKSRVVTNFEPVKLVDGKMSVVGIISATEDVSIDIKQAPSKTKPAGAPTTVTITKRPAAPKTAKFVYDRTDDLDKATLIGATEDMEFMAKGTGTWNPCSAIGNEVELPKMYLDYYVRYKGTDSDFPSANQTVQVICKRAEPKVTYSADTETFSGVETYLEYSINNGVFGNSLSVKTMNITDMIDKLPQDRKLTVAFRSARKETAPVGVEKTFTIGARAAAPGGIAFDKATNKLSGLKSSMQYREKGTTAWRAIGSTTLDMKSFINGRPNVSVEVRYKAASGLSASKPVVINLY